MTTTYLGRAHIVVQLDRPVPLLDAGSEGAICAGGGAAIAS
jgi:hypothetical protein